MVAPGSTRGLYNSVMPRKLQPCGTPAAAHRHYRHNEPLDEACRLAYAADSLRRYHEAPDPLPDGPEIRPIRNGMPWKPYVYRAPRQAWAVAAITEMEARYGRPREEAGYLSRHMPGSAGRR
jgi:hypothetical protein